VKRPISHTEMSTVHDCQARHAFAYTGHLTGGDTLKPKQTHLRLREGRAWGRAIAALHAADERPAVTPGSSIARGTALGQQQLMPAAGSGSAPPASGHIAIVGSALLHRYLRGLRELQASLDEDAAQLQEHGFYHEDEHADMAARLAELLWHYAHTSEPLSITDPEIELRVPMPSRTGRSVSSRYLFHGHLDGLTMLRGRPYIVEYKLRGRLSTLEQVALGRQYRRYAWAAERALDTQIAGVVVDERLNEIPKRARWVKGRKKSEGMVPSHAKDQLTTAELYLEACVEAGVEPDTDTATALEQRRWQARHTLTFRRSEIEEAGRELVSSAHLIAQLDAGVLHPVRNPSPQRCSGCPFRDVCPNADDRELIDLHFERRSPKRHHEEAVS
jgi:hypothetical protein